jgi:large conductance mechanosensitive channel
MFKGFKNFLTRGDVVVVAIGLIVATALSTLIKAFTDSIVTPIIARAQGASSTSLGLGIQLGQGGNTATFVNFGTLISAFVYFLTFMAVVYFVIVLPYKAVQARRGVTVFGEPATVKTCPACLSDDLPLGATKCRYCGSDQPPTETAP